MSISDNHYINKAFKISIAIEICLVAASGLVLYSNFDHSNIFLAMSFHLPGSIVGLFMLEVISLKGPFALLFAISAFASALLQIIFFTTVLSFYMKWKTKHKEKEVSI